MSDCGCSNFPASLGNVTFASSVGIGTTTPGASLEVAGSGALFSGTLATETPTGNVYAGVFGGTPRIIFGGSTSHEIDNASGTLRLFRPGAAPDILVDENGHVGLGTSTPQSALDLESPGAAITIGGTKVADASGCYYA